MAEGKPTYRLPGREVRAEQLAEALYAVAFRALTPKDVARFSGVNDRYASAALLILEQLGLVERLPDGFRANPSAAETIKKLNTEQRPVLFARHAMRYKPFVEFVAIIHKGYSASEAATKVNVVYGLGVDDRFVEQNFRSLGIYAGLLQSKEEQLALSIVVDELPTDYFDKLKEATMGEVHARLFIRERIGEKAYHYLGDEQVEDFAKALLTFRTSPCDAIVAVGRAVEDFLRTVGTEKGAADYRTSNGTVDLGNRMRTEEPPLVLPGHVARTHFVGMLRNPGGGHGKDKETLERWHVSPEAALEAVLAGLSCVRSVHAYVFLNLQAL